MVDKPEFDPSKPFEEIKSEFDPSKPFETVGATQSVASPAQQVRERFPLPNQGGLSATLGEGKDPTSGLTSSYDATGLSEARPLYQQEDPNQFHGIIPSFAQGVIDAIRLGQAYVRSDAARSKPVEDLSPPTPVGDTMYIEHRKKPAILGWRCIESLSVRGE